MSTQNESRKTTDHNTIKKWAEERNGKPAVVKNTERTGEGDGLLRINFPGYEERNLKNIEWEEFFEIFDNHDLQFLYQEETKDGALSRFCKFIDNQ